MGEIQKQSIRGTVFIYAGAIIGFVISGLLFPRFLTTEQIGLIAVLVSYSAIFAQLSSLGFVSATTRMFPFFRDDKNRHNGFLFLGNSTTFIGFLVVSIGFFFLKPYLIDKETSSPLLLQYSFLIYPLAFLTVFFNFHDHYNKVLFNASRGLLLKEFILRVAIVLLIVFLVIKLIDFKLFVYLYVLCYAVPLVLIIILLLKDNQLSYLPKKGFIDKDLIKPLISVSFYGILISATGQITINIDRIMVESYLGLDNAGIYTTCFFFGTIVILPSRAILKISSAYIADAFKNKNLPMVYDIYHKTSINQFVVGILLFIGIWVNEKNIFEILGFDFLPGKWVVFFIGLAFLLDMLSGASAWIIGNSDQYRMQALFMLIMIALVVVTNIIFIPLMGIVGAALASFLSKLLFHIIKFIYIWKRFDMQPYNFKFVSVGLIAVASYYAGYFLPQQTNYLMDIAIRSIVTGLLFSVLIYLFNISEELSLAANNLAKRVFKR